ITTGIIKRRFQINHTSSYGPILVIVEDPSGLSDSTAFSVAVSNVNRQPIIDVIDDRVMLENDTLEFAISAFDPDGDALTLTAINLPLFAQFIDNGGGSGTFIARPGFADAGFYDNITIIATEASGSINETFSLSVNNLNRAPSIVPIANQNIDEGTRRVVEVIASDPDSDPLDVALSNQPAFVQLFDSSNGNRYIEIAPGADDAGQYFINVTATDPSSASVTDTFEVQVANVLGLTDANGSVPTEFVLEQNYPNPFNPSTTIAFGLPQSGSVKIVVYNSVGQKVGVILEERLEAGYYEKTFSADNLPSGVYLYRMEAAGFQDIKKFVLLK
ncbi:MAG: Ig-like domain-containing protein, partial [Calditrichota bacterium]